MSLSPISNIPVICILHALKLSQLFDVLFYLLLLLFCFVLVVNSLPPAPSGNPGNRVHHPLPPPVRPQTRSCACALARLTRPEPRPSPVRQRQRRRRNAWRLEPMRKRRRRAELSGWGRGPGFLLAAGWLVPRPRSFRALRGGLRHTLGRACSV